MAPVGAVLAAPPAVSSSRGVELATTAKAASSCRSGGAASLPLVGRGERGGSGAAVAAAFAGVAWCWSAVAASSGRRRAAVRALQVGGSRRRRRSMSGAGASLGRAGCPLAAPSAPAPQPRRRVMAAAADDSAAAVKEALAAKEAEYRRKREAARGSASDVEVPPLSDLKRTSFVGDDGLLQIPAVEKGVRASVYAIWGPDDQLQYVGISRNSQTSLRTHFARCPENCGTVAVFDVRKPDRALLEAAKQAWLGESDEVPPGNADPKRWEQPLDVRASMSDSAREEMEAMPAAQAEAALREAVLAAEAKQVEAFEEFGCEELLLFDAKLKAKGFLDLDTNAPIGIVRPAGGVGATFTVELLKPNGEKVEVECAADITILDAAEQADVELPSSCKSGACSACAAKIVEGTVDQSDQSFLSEAQEEDGYVLTCVAYARSDLKLEVDKQADVA